jgi:undecaprenyl-diphosphatase
MAPPGGEDVRERLREPRILAAMAAASAGLWVFVEVADEVLEGEAAAVDRTLLLMFRSSTDAAEMLGPAWLESAARDITALGGLAVLGLIVAIAAGFLFLAGRRRTALFVAAATGGGALASTVLKLAFSRPRPDLVPHAAEVTSASFPSGHAMVSAVVYLTLAALLARLVATNRLKVYIIGVAVLLTLLIGVSRIYLGVHWPSDVLAGWAAGSAWALGSWAVARLVHLHGEGRG